MRTRRRMLFGALAAVVALAGACGSRTGLLAPPEEDAGEAGFDAARHDASPPVADALPPIDVSEPVDVASACPDASITLVYLISLDNSLYSFYPPTAAFTFIGTIQCPIADPSDEPYSMAVDRNGVAYTVFSNPNSSTGPGPSPGGELFRLSTATAACEATPYKVRSDQFHTFGMGFSKDTTGTAETLFVASATPPGAPPATLATIDVNTFQLDVIGTIQPPSAGAELTGTGAGDLFGFFSTDDGTSSAIGQLDKTTGALVGQTNLPGLAEANGWAFAFWGGDFYLFTAPDPTFSIVTRYRPSDGSVVQVGQAPDVIVGAGVSTCAPQR